jgi:hypothetical protein
MVMSSGYSAIPTTYVLASLLDPSEAAMLKRRYESALRVWGKYQFPLHNAPLLSAEERAAQMRLRQSALKARNAARKIISKHIGRFPAYPPACSAPQAGRTDFAI